MSAIDPATEPAPSPTSWILVAIGWTLVGVPLAWGIYNTFAKALILFK